MWLLCAWVYCSNAGSAHAKCARVKARPPEPWTCGALVQANGTAAVGGSLATARCAEEVSPKYHVSTIMLGSHSWHRCARGTSRGGRKVSLMAQVCARGTSSTQRDNPLRVRYCAHHGRSRWAHQQRNRHRQASWWPRHRRAALRLHQPGWPRSLAHMGALGRLQPALGSAATRRHS